MAEKKTAALETAQPRLKELYNKELKAKLEKELGLEKVLVTCRDNNVGSRRTIEKCLGEQDKSVPSRYPNIMELRYWINTKTLKK